MWRDVTAVSTLRGDLTFIVSLSLRKHEIPRQLGKTLSSEFHEYSKIFKRQIPASYFKLTQAVEIPWAFKNIQAHKSWKFLEISSSIFLQVTSFTTNEHFELEHRCHHCDKLILLTFTFILSTFRNGSVSRRFVRCLFQRIVVCIMNSGLSGSHPSICKGLSISHLCPNPIFPILLVFFHRIDPSPSYRTPNKEVGKTSSG